MEDFGIYKLLKCLKAYMDSGSPVDRGKLYAQIEAMIQEEEEYPQAEMLESDEVKD